ncbi:hypothetical protein V1279_006511 [Bradyrhizobium sp. AZCC 1610]
MKDQLLAFSSGQRRNDITQQMRSIACDEAAADREAAAHYAS